MDTEKELPGAYPFHMLLSVWDADDNGRFLKYFYTERVHAFTNQNVSRALAEQDKELNENGQHGLLTRSLIFLN